MSERAERAKTRDERVGRRSARLSVSSPFLKRPATQTPFPPSRTPAATPTVPVPGNPPSTPQAGTTASTKAPGLTPASLVHVVQEVWGYPPDSILEQALEYKGIKTFVDLLSLTTSTIDTLIYPVSQPSDPLTGPVADVERDVPEPLKGVVKGFLGYVVYRQTELYDPLTIHNCISSLDHDDFQNYRCTASFQIFNNSPTGQPVIPSPIQAPKPNRPRTPAEEFARGIKLDPTYYPILKQDKGFDQFDRAFVATVRSHNMLPVLDPNYEPQTPEEIELFECYQAFLYRVFTVNLLTTKGKELVRKYQDSYDAQSIYDDLVTYHRASEKAAGDKTSLLFFIMNNQLTADSWFDTHDNYITHWNEQVRLYNELETTAQLQEHMLIMFLGNAVSLQPHLESVRTTSDTIQAAGGPAVDLTYLSYRNLLHDAAQRYDRTHQPRGRRRNGTRRVSYHDLAEPVDTALADNYDNYNYDLDASLDDITSYQAFRAQSGFNRRHNPSRLPNDRWQLLSDDARRLWHQMPQDAKAAILGTSSPATTLPPPRRANAHVTFDPERMGRDNDVSTLATETTNGETEPTGDTLLAYATSQKNLPPGNLQRLMSNKLAQTPAISRQPAKDSTKAITTVKKHEVLIDDSGNIYRINNVSIVYSVNNHSSRTGTPLVDRGANGGLSGNDVRTITKTTRQVNVQGIDQHQVTDRTIVTSCGYTESQRGPIIVILNQQADMGSGQTILSSPQMEAFGIKVDDRSTKAGGTQSITTPDGFCIPLQFHNGLPHMALRPPTDRELANPNIPHVVLTSDADWDPTILDSTFDMDTWKNSIPDYESDEGERPFDSVGILKSNRIISINKNETVVEDLLNAHDQHDTNMDLNGLYESIPRPPSELDWFEVCMADVLGLDPQYVTPPMPPEYEVNEIRTRKSVLFQPDPPTVFDLESEPLVSKDSFKHLAPQKETPDLPRSKRSVVFDVESIPLKAPGNPTNTNTDGDEQSRRRPGARNKESDGSKDNPRAEPPPRTVFDDDPPSQTTAVYKNPSSAVKSRERDWERLRKYFAWLPKLVIQKTFDCTTQLARIPMSAHLQRHYKSPFPALNVKRRDEDVATDTVYADTPDIEHGHVAAQFFVGTTSLVSDIYGVKTEAQFLQTLQDNVRKRGAMNKLVSDRAQAEVSSAVKDYMRWLLIDDWQSEPHRQNQNYAERRYQDVKRLANRILDRTGAPPSLWLLALRYASFVYNHTAVKSLGWKTPMSVLTGITPDISVLLRFAFYEKVLYKTEEPSFPSDSTESLGYMVGIAEHVGHAMTYKILNPETNKIIFRSEIRSANAPNDPNKHLAPSDGEMSTPPTIIKSRSDDFKTIIYSSDEESDDPDALVHNKDLIGRTFLLAPDKEGHVKRAKIVELLDQHEHQTTTKNEHIRFKLKVGEEGYEDVMAYNDILERLEADKENPTVWRFKRITGHQGPLRPDHPSYMGSTYNVTMEWENGEITPEPLSIIAKDAPVVCAIYARDNNLLDLPGWRRFKSIAKNQKKLLRLANQAKLRSFRTAKKYMYGFEIPKDYADAIRLDRLHENTKWQDCTKLEMDQLKEYKVFVDMGEGTPIPKGYQKIRVHLVYAVKHDGRHKARLVADGHLTDVPVDSVYSGVVSIRGLKMMVFLAELNGLDTWATDIGNAYLEAYTTEKVAIVAGPEFGELEGHTLIVSRALYGLRMSGKMWHQRFAACLEEEGFFPCKAEPDIWMRPTKDGSSYEYVGVYVDDLAMVMKDPKTFTDRLINIYKFKLKGTGPLEFHLGCSFFRDEHGTLCMSPKKYIARMVDSYERMFGQKPKTTYTSPLEKGDHPECDTSELLEPEGVTQYQSLVGQLQWAISIGRLDIATAVMTMSSFRSCPRIGHLERAKRICGYLHKMKEACIRFRTGLPDYSDLNIPHYEWGDSVYGCPKEEIPQDAPEPLGLPVILTHYVDANLYHCMLTGRSVTGIIHMINGTPIDAFSKKQSTVETATYGSEYVAARTCVEQIMDLRSTLRYLGVRIQGRSYMFGDNESVVNSSSRPDSKLHKRHVALSFHRVREAIASNMLSFLHIQGAHNPADILSKHWGYQQVWPLLRTLLFYHGDTADME